MNSWHAVRYVPADLRPSTVPVSSVYGRMGYWWLGSCTLSAQTSPAHSLTYRQSERYNLSKVTCLRPLPQVQIDSAQITGETQPPHCRDKLGGGSYVAGQLSCFHGVLGLPVQTGAFVVPLYVVRILLFVPDLQGAAAKQMKPSPSILGLPVRSVMYPGAKGT